jgi:hypothetical protein
MKVENLEIKCLCEKILIMSKTVDKIECSNCGRGYHRCNGNIGINKYYQNKLPNRS